MRVHWITTHSTSTSIGLAEIETRDEHMADQIVSELDHLHPKKKLEFLTSRRLIETMCREVNVDYRGIRKDEFGKPYLVDSDYHISISHSYPMVACALHPTKPCGIDIESARSQLLKIRHKFLNPQELEFCGEDLDKLCIHWAAKEALYKIYGRKRLIFAEQLAVTEITEEGIKAQVIQDSIADNYLLNYKAFLKYFLVYNV